MGGSSDSAYVSLGDGGFLRLARSLADQTPGTVLRFSVDAADGGGRHTELPVRLRVLAAHTDPAQAVTGFAAHPATVDVTDSPADVGRTLATLTARIGSGLPASSVRYRLLALSKSLARPTLFQSGLYGADLAVDFLTGHLRVAAPLDSHLCAEYQAVVRAFVPAQPASFATTVVTVRVSAATAAPIFRQPVFEFSVAENLSPATAVGTVKADSATAGAIRYALIPATGAPVPPFAVDAASGALTTTAQLDREARGAWELNCSAADAASGRTAFADVHVIVRDDNDRQPFGTSAYFKVRWLRDWGVVI